MERVSDDWLNDAIQTYSIIDSKSKGANVYLALCELRERRQNEIKAQQEIEKLKVDGHTDNSASEKYGAEATQEKTVLPIPCTKGFEDWTVKQWFAKINEELDELKTAVLACNCGLDFKMQLFLEEQVPISNEAADTITAITSMLEAMGIDEQQRQAAQMRVNAHNRHRGRC